jgi:putative sterol carrier protein
MILYDTEWVTELARQTAADEAFQKKAKGFDAIYQYVVKAPKDQPAGEARCFWFAFPACTQFGMGKHDKPTYTMTTSYEVMHDVLTGKTNAVMALTMRKVFVSGDLMRLLRFTGAINRIVELMQHIPAQAEGALAAIA